MNALAVSLFAFVALHSVPAMPSVRSRLITWFGRRTYLFVYSVISKAVMTFVVRAALTSEYVELWPVASWQILLTLFLSPLGLFLVIAGPISPNPASVTLRPEMSMGAVTSITRHPTLWGFILWSFGHLAPNGDLRSLILFGGLGLFSVGGLIMAEARARKRLGAAWPSIALMSSVLPLAALVRGRTRLRIDMPLLAALLMTIALTAWLLADGHALLFGPDPLAMLNF